MKAFPLKSVNMFDDNDGMDLRDYFAARAMQGLLSNSNVKAEWINKNLIKESWAIANAMMKAREQ
jgi:hypothetical protein